MHKEGERQRRETNGTKGGGADVADIVPLWGAGAEGPSAVIYNRTSLFVSSSRVINGTLYPLCRELVSVSRETDKHIMHKC